MITFLLASLYVTFLMVEADVFAKVRLYLIDRSSFLLALLSCYKCSAFWAGVFCTILLLLNPVFLYPLAAAENKRIAIYAERAAAAAGLVGLLLSDLTDAQLKAYQVFRAYMGIDGFTNGRGRIYTLLDASQAPIEYKVEVTQDSTGYWNIGSINPQWADFMAACGVETNLTWNFATPDPCWALTGNIGFSAGALYAGGGSASGGGVAYRKILTTPGQLYNLIYTVGRNGSGGNIGAKAEIIDDSTGATLLNTTDPLGTYTKPFTAIGQVSMLRFTDTSTGSPSADLMIDNVSVVAV